MPPQPKPHLDGLPQPIHGGISGLARSYQSAILDFSTCGNPYRPPLKIYSAMRSADIRHYPDPDSSGLTGELSARLGLPQEQLIAGSGSTELIRLAATAYFGPGDLVIVPSPTYGEYELSCRIAGAAVVKYLINEKDEFRLQINSFISFARRQRPSGIFLCNPNNPSGQHLPQEAIKRIVAAFPDSLIILDEAYIAFIGRDDDSAHLLMADNLLIIRSMTKDYSMAGLRLGYAMACREIINALKKVRPPWNVSSAAERAGIAALSCGDFIPSCMERIHASQQYLTNELYKLGFKIIPTDANFFIFKVGDAGRFKRRLLEKGILVRDCTSFGLPEYVRIAPGTRPQCIKFIKAVRALLGEAP